jgi:hypothetical protein
MNEFAKVSQEEMNELPEPLRKQAEETNKVIDRHNKALKGDENSDETEPKEEVKTKPEGESDEKEEATPGTVSEPTTEASEPEDTEPAQEDWKEKALAAEKKAQKAEQQWRSLQGIHRKETSKLRDQIKTLKANNVEQQGVTQQTRTKKETPPATAPDLQSLDKEMLNAFNEDELKILKKWNDANITHAVNRAVSQYVKPTEDRLNKVVTNLAEDEEDRYKQTIGTFIEQIREKIPNVEELDDHPKSGEFFDSVIPNTSTTYRQQVSDAFDDQNLELIVSIYDTYTNYLGKEKPSAPKPKPNIEPGRSLGPGKQQPKGKLINRADLNKMYKRIIELESNPATAEEAKKIYNEIDQARMDGRLVA